VISSPWFAYAPSPVSHPSLELRFTRFCPIEVLSMTDDLRGQLQATLGTADLLEREG